METIDTEYFVYDTPEMCVEAGEGTQEDYSDGIEASHLVLPDAYSKCIHIWVGDDADFEDVLQSIAEQLELAEAVAPQVDFYTGQPDENARVTLTGLVCVRAYEIAREVTQ